MSASLSSTCAWDCKIRLGYEWDGDARHELIELLSNLLGRGVKEFTFDLFNVSKEALFRIVGFIIEWTRNSGCQVRVRVNPESREALRITHLDGVLSVVA